MRNAVTLLFGCTLPVLPAARSSPAAGNIVWQIGTFDQSSHEFNNNAPVGKKYYNPVFTIGKSKASDWPGRQPGSQNQAQGLKPHPFTILFDLPAKPSGTYTLAISALLYNTRFPHLEISINGSQAALPLPRVSSLSSPDVLVEDWKNAMDCHGTIVRLVEAAGQNTTTRLTFPLFQLQQPWTTNSVEQDQSSVKVEWDSLEVSPKPHQIRTLRVVASD